MIYSPDKYKKNYQDLNLEFSKLKGVLNDKEAKVTLTKFLRSNLGFTTELISGIKLAAYQEIHLKALLNRNFNMCIWGRGCGKTVSYNNTWVIEKNKGLILLKDLIPNVDFESAKNNNYILDIPEIKLWNGKSWQNTNKIIVQQKKKCLKIKTERGYELIGSINHIIKSIKSDGKIHWTKYPELKVNDYVCIERNSINKKHYFDKESYLIGLLIGDGCYSDKIKWIAYTTADKQLANFVIKNTRNSNLRNKTKFLYEIRINNNFSKYLIDKYKIKRSLSYTKQIPSEILCDFNKLKSCLSGLFDTDGWVDKKIMRIGFCSVSKVLAEQVHLSLLSFGIVSSLRICKTKSKFGLCYKVEISGQDCLKFNDEISFKLNRKNNILNKHIKSNKKINTNKDIIPYVKDVCNNIKKNNKINKNDESNWRCNIRKRDQKNISYISLSKYLDLFDKNNINDNQIENLKEIQKENFYFDKIKSIEEIDEDCIDFNIPIGEKYWSNGFISHNSFVAAVFCFLQCVFEPNTKILIAGPTFRTARFIFNNLEKIVDSKGGELLKQAFGAKSKRNDQYEWQINGGSIVAIPLSGEKIRGFRANVLVLDEFLLLSEDIVKTVLMPFLVAPQNMKERMDIREMEDNLIKEGAMKEEDRMVFTNNSKMIALSSASYTFENLYKTHNEWVEKIISKEESEATYFISQMSYEALPEEMIDKTIIEEAQAGGSSHSSFLREYCARFIDGSDSYFSAKKMEECTIPNGQAPHTLMKGLPNKKYILGIDPNMSDSPNADYFAMAVIEVDDETKTGTLVHTYAGLGNLKNHVQYLYYIMTNFNIVFAILDNAGADVFVSACNQSELFKNNNLKINSFEFNSDLEGVDYDQEVRKARNSYNLENKKIAFNQVFTSNFIRKANEHLQACIDYKRIWFASKACANDDFFQSQFSLNIPLDLMKSEGKDDWSTLDFIENQDDFIYQTKKQCTLVEHSSTARGTQSFDLPQHLKRSSSANKARKDNYSALLLANWGLKCYNDILNAPKEEISNTFTPIMIK